MGSHDQGLGSFTGNFAMAGISLEEFEHKVIATCSNSAVVQSAAVFELKPSWIRLRIFLINETFVDVFYSEGTGKTSYAQIKNGKRIFGADNAGGWHWHPYDDPDQHLASVNEIRFEEFLQQVEVA